MHGAVDRRSGGGEDADDAEGLVAVLTHCSVAQAVAEGDFPAHGIGEAPRHFAADHGLEDAGEGAAGREAQGFALAEAEVAEVVGAGAQHREAAMRIAQRQWHRPIHGGMGGDCLIAGPADVVAGCARVEHCVEHQLHGAGAGADHQVDPGYGL